MSLRDILVSLQQNNTQVLLNDGSKDWDADDLLETLPELKLKRSAYMQPGMYIAEINDGGYLGRVLYKLKQKA